ncbi:MAG: hypothetical protein ACK5ZC_14905 [Pirellulaceae bacterium]
MQSGTEGLGAGWVQLPVLRRWVIWIFGLLSLIFGRADPVDAQSDPSPIPSGVALWHQSGPFGVATIRLPRGVVDTSRMERLEIRERDGRLFYPAMSWESMPVTGRPGRDPLVAGEGRILSRLRGAIRMAIDAVDPPSQLRIDFLFRGVEPLHLELVGDYSQRMKLTPQVVASDPYDSMVTRWWQSYSDQAQARLSRDDYPGVVDRYLLSMLARRMARTPQRWLPKVKIPGVTREDVASTLAMIAGFESQREAILEEVLEGVDSRQQPVLPLPESPRWEDPAIDLRAGGEEVSVEPMAEHVPIDCFYLRFGSFTNYLWFERRTAQGAGDLLPSLMLRGLDTETSGRMAERLQVRTTMVAKLFGDAVIEDVALMGLDLFFQDGPSLGVLFQARQMGLLRSSMERDRAEALAAGQSRAMREEKVEIEGEIVSLLTTPDHSVRSFLVSDASHLLVTSSRAVVERFIRVSQGRGPTLAQSPVFRLAREQLPPGPEDVLFGFFSPEFLRGLVSPHTQIELRRRLAARARLQAADMASLAARKEGVPEASIRSLDTLVRLRLLPESFSSVDGVGRVLTLGDRWVDPERGGLGHFLPIADMEVGKVTEEESAHYRKQADFYQNDWRQTDPLVFRMRRYKHPEDQVQERIAVEAYVAPFGKEKWGWFATILAPASPLQVMRPEADVVHAQIQVVDDPLARHGPSSHTLILGIQDHRPPPFRSDRGLLSSLWILKSLPIYLGAWPETGWLDRLPWGMGGGPPDSLGFSKLLIGMWRWQGAGFSLLSFDRQVLERCIAAMRPQPAADPAQVRLFIGPLHRSQIASWIASWWYQRVRRASEGNSLLTDSLQQQLGVPPAQSREVAESLLDAKLRCPLGGQYELASVGGMQRWTSTQASSNAVDHKVAPDSYQAPWTQWFGGAQVHLTQLPDQLILLGQIDLAKIPDAPEESALPLELPKMPFDFFQLPFRNIKPEKAPVPAPKKAPATIPARQDF